MTLLREMRRVWVGEGKGGWQKEREQRKGILGMLFFVSQGEAIKET